MSQLADPAIRRRRDDIDAVCAKTTDVAGLFGEVSARLRRIVPFDGATWFATDPGTLLATRPALIENIEDGHCETFWQREFLVDDVMLFADLARTGTVTATLETTTAGRPARSARYREFLAPQGFGDELRALLQVGRQTWGVVSLYREDGRTAFSETDAELVRSLSRPIGSALRSQLFQRRSAGTGLPSGPGMIVLDRTYRPISINDDGLGWLEELPPEMDFPLPIAVVSVAQQARAIAEGRETGRARLRVQTVSGRWALVHASVMSDGLTVLVIEAAQASEIAPIIVDAYGLSPREQQVTQLLARGCNTTQIAQELMLSTHTVRDYVKALLDKVGVGSRGELVAKLFADHYAPDLHAADATDVVHGHF
jgi:DNA-binding CsgD family transcriptional regulator